MTQQAIEKVLQLNAEFRFVVKLGHHSEIEDEDERWNKIREENRANAQRGTDFEAPIYNVWKQPLLLTRAKSGDILLL